LFINQRVVPKNPPCWEAPCFSSALATEGFFGLLPGMLVRGASVVRACPAQSCFC